MRKRFVRVLVFVAVALGVAVGAAGAAGAIDSVQFGGGSTEGSMWD